MNTIPDKEKHSEKSSLHYDTRFQYRYVKPEYWTTWVSIFIIFFVGLLPVAMQDALANRLGDLARNINKKRRRIARNNIDICYPDISEEEKKQWLRDNFRHQARSILHYGWFWWAPVFVQNKRIKTLGEEYIQQSLTQGRSVIIMAAHSLGLEAAVSVTSLRYPVTGPFNPMKNKLIDWFVAKGRIRHGTNIYTREAGLRPVIKDVRKGRVMFYLPDEDLGRDRSIFVPFYSVQKATVPVLGRLAKSCHADVIPCMTCYDEKNHQYVVHYLPKISAYPTGEDLGDARMMNQELERLIDICPQHYFWTMKLFKTRPENEASFYK